MARKLHSVMGLHPSSRGFGWIVLEGPDSLFDWGTADIPNRKNERALRRIEMLLDRYQPVLIVLEDFQDDYSRRRPRVRRLCRAIIRRAEQREIAVRIYARSHIERAVTGQVVRTRDQIAAAVAFRFPVLQPRLPKPRQIWVGEHPSMALFSAAACAASHYLIEHA